MAMKFYSLLTPEQITAFIVLNHISKKIFDDVRSARIPARGEYHQIAPPAHFLPGH